MPRPPMKRHRKSARAGFGTIAAIAMREIKRLDARASRTRKRYSGNARLKAY